MKYLLYTLIAFWLIQLPVSAQCPSLTVITQSTSQEITMFNSVSCNFLGLHTDNSYLRVFDLAALGIDVSFDVSRIEFGIERASSVTGIQDVTLNLYTLEGVLSFANLTLIHSQNIPVADQSRTILNVLLTTPVTLPAGSQLVVEVFTPNGILEGNSFFIGSNSAPETSFSYIAAASCLVPEPATTGSVGFPNMHIVMNVIGCEVNALVPTLNEWSLLILGISLLIVGVITIRQHQTYEAHYLS